MSEKTRILIADDEPINRDFFDVMLTNLGFEVVLAEDGEKALRKITSENPDLIIMDSILPKMSGWKLTRLLKTDESCKDYRDIPIIMFSALDNVKDKIEGLELGVEDYITKPFNFSEVLARIRAVLRHRELSLQVARQRERLRLAKTLNHSYGTFLTDLTRRLKAVRDAPGGTNSFDELISFVERETAILGSEGRGLYDTKDAEEEETSLSLKDLEQRFQKQFNAWKQSQEIPDEDA